jgi:K+-sensing histidine kinase KdpD
MDLCPATEERTVYADLFLQSGVRLHNLIEDATLINDMSKLNLKSGETTACSELLAEIRGSLLSVQIIGQPSSEWENGLLIGYRPLLKRALESMILLATCFSKEKQAVHLSGKAAGKSLRVRIDLDALALSAEQVAEFFALESAVRSMSSAESMGLAPVVAHQIVSVLGGTLKLVKGVGTCGYLEAELLQETRHA